MPPRQGRQPPATTPEPPPQHPRQTAVQQGEHPQVLSLLEDARQHPEEDGPRLVLADWLEENGAPERAEFVRLQCRLAPGSSPLSPDQRQSLTQRCDRLLGRRGGAWLGPLWRWRSALSWQRGLLAVRLPRRLPVEDLAEVAPWLDTLLLSLSGREQLRQALDLLATLRLNHATLEMRSPVGEGPLLGALARLPESRCMRSLSFTWPLRMQQGDAPLVRVPAVSESFLRLLVRECPVGRWLTHLGSSPRFSSSQAEVLLQAGVQAEPAGQHLWMHQLPPSAFAPRSRGQGK